MSAGCAATSARVAEYARASPSRAADDAEHDRLGEQLAQQPAAAGAERGANGQLACRADARASSRLATFAQATSSTKPTAPSSTSSGSRTSPSIVSRSGEGVERQRCRWSRGTSPAAACPIRRRSSSTCASRHARLRPADHGQELASSAVRRRGAERVVVRERHVRHPHRRAVRARSASTPTIVGPARRRSRPCGRARRGRRRTGAARTRGRATRTPSCPGWFSPGSKAPGRARPAGPADRSSPSLTIVPRTSRGSPAPSMVKTPRRERLDLLEARASARARS